MNKRKETDGTKKIARIRLVNITIPDLVCDVPFKRIFRRARRTIYIHLKQSISVEEGQRRDLEVRTSLAKCYGQRSVSATNLF